jgi:hypothetical protein
MFLMNMLTGILANWDSPVDISLAACATEDTSGLFPAFKAGVNMPAKYTECFIRNRQFGFPPSFVINIFELAVNKNGWHQQK